MDNKEITEAVGSITRQEDVAITDYAENFYAGGNFYFIETKDNHYAALEAVNYVKDPMEETTREAIEDSFGYKIDLNFTPIKLDLGNAPTSVYYLYKLHPLNKK